MPNPIVAVVLARLRNLRFPVLAGLAALLFIVTLLVPDPLPFADELLLGVLTLLLANWQRRRGPPEPPQDPR